MSDPTITAEQVKTSRRLADLADETMQERQRWVNVTIRSELLWISRQLAEASRIALGSSEIYGDAWCEAGTLTLRKYVGARKLIETVTP